MAFCYVIFYSHYAHGLVWSALQTHQGDNDTSKLMQWQHFQDCFVT